MIFQLETPPALLAVGVLALSVSIGQARTFCSADVHAKDFPINVAVKDNVKIFGDSSLGSEKDTIEQVKIGALDMLRVSSASFRGIVPESVILSPPFLFGDIEHVRKTMCGPQGDKIPAAFDKGGFIGPAPCESCAHSVHSKRPIETLADMKGLKMRGQPSDLMARGSSVCWTRSTRGSTRWLSMRMRARCRRSARCRPVLTASLAPPTCA